MTPPQKFWDRLALLGEHLYQRGVLLYQPLAHNDLYQKSLHFADSLADSLFPELQKIRVPTVTLHLVENHRFQADLVHQQPREIFQDTHLSDFFARNGITTLELDTLLETNQIVNILALLIHADGKLRQTAKPPRRILNAKSLAAQLCSANGLNTLCANIGLDQQTQTLTIRYSYCELFFSSTITTFLERYTTSKNHQAFFSLAPKLGGTMALLFLLHHLFWAPLSFFGLGAALLGSSFLGIFCAYLISTIGSVLYDQEHREKLLQENMKEITALSHIPAHNPNPILKLAEDGSLLFANRAADTQRELMGFSHGACLHILPDNFQELIDRALQEQQELFDIEVCKRGRVLRFNFSPFQGERTVLASGTDITRLKELERELRDLNKHLEANVIARTQELASTQDITILSLSSLAETRDPETGAHIQRTRLYVRLLAQHLQHHPRFQQALADNATIDLLYRSAPLHDIGKVGIPDAILLKPKPLTDEEFAIMKTHPVIGGDALKWAVEKLGENSFLEFAREIAYGHHEKWDGSGYPYGLKGEAIPLSCRLMALADVYDALVNKRVYKEAYSHERAKEILLKKKGSHFDPDIVDAFLALEQEFIAIARKYAEDD